MNKNNLNNQNGAIAIITLMVIGVFALAVMTTMSVLATSELKMSGSELASEKTFYAAEAGINEALYRMIGQPIVPPFTLDFDGMQVEVNIDTSGHQRTIVSKATDSTDKERTLQLSAHSSVFAGGFDYAVQSGQGGIQIENNSEIYGDIYSNGNVFGSNPAMPKATVYGNVSVARGTDLTDVPNQITSNTQLAVADVASKTDVAQSFVPNISDQLKAVTIYIKKNANLSSDPVLRIVNDNGSGSPSNDVIAYKAIDKTKIKTTIQEFPVIFDIGPLLTADQTYWIVIDSTFEASKFIIMEFDTTNPYADGEARSSADYTTGAWSDLVGDFKFKTSFGTGDTFARYIKVENYCTDNNYFTMEDCKYAGEKWRPGNLAAHKIEGSVIVKAEDPYLEEPEKYGNAYYQTITDTTVSGSACPNSHCHHVSDDPPVRDFPITQTDIDDWKAEAAVNTIPGNHIVSGSEHLGPVKIEGNLDLSDNADLTIDGHIWVTGNITLVKPNLKIQLNSSFGDGSGVLIADGKIDINNNATLDGVPGNQKSFLLILSTHNSLNPLSPAINAANNSNSIILYAQKGMVRQYNGSNLNATTGYYVLLEQVSTITYDPNLLGFYTPSDDEEEIDPLPDTWQEL